MVFKTSGSIKESPERAPKWVLAVNEMGSGYSDQSSVSSWLVQPIKELSSAAGLCAGRGCALIRQLANYPLVTFFDCPVLSCPVLSLPFFLDPTPRSNRWTDFHAFWLKQSVSAQGWSFWGLEGWIGDHIWKKYALKTSKNGRE